MTTDAPPPDLEQMSLDELIARFTGNSKMLSKKRQILDLLAEGATVADLCYRFEFSQHAYYGMRRRDKAFDVACKLFSQVSSQSTGKWSEGKKLTFDPSRPMPRKGEFAAWRMKYLGRPTTALGQAIADAMLDTTSRIVFIHAPPGGGKDTTVGDTVLYMKCDDRHYTRVAWIMETENMARRRVGERLEPYLSDPTAYRSKPGRTPGAKVPKSTLIDDFGPYKWERGMRYPDGTPVQKTTWTQNEIRFLQSAAAPEADPDLWATGMQAALYGSRVQLMVFSDLFTKENQRNPTEREAQFEWVKGTAESRLDGSGRVVYIHTRVSPDDNQGRLMKHYIGDAPIHESTSEGPITVTRYVNGVTKVTCVAIWTDENGEERSFDPDRFPLDDCWLAPDQVTTVPFDELTLDEARAGGYARKEGLRTLRERDTEWFETAYQQNPQSTKDIVDFTDETLDRAMAPDRSYGIIRPREVLVLGVDPARVGWAGWALGAVDLEAETVSLVDYRLMRGLGIEGIKRQLLAAPIAKYRPPYLAYEVNHEGGVLHDPDVEGLLRDFGVTLIRHETTRNRMDPEVGVARMAGWMIQHRILLPSATPSDKAKTLTVRQHFKNWDADPQSRRKQHRKKESQPDEIAMAFWFLWLHARDLIDRYQRGRHQTTPAKQVPQSIARRWQAKLGRRASVRTHAGSERRQDVDLLREYLGEH